MITEATNKYYDEHYKEWERINKFLTGKDVATELDIGTHEGFDRYAYRTRNFDFHPLTSNAIQKLVGLLYSNAEDIVRDGRELFDEDVFTHIGLESEDYEVILTEIATNLLAFNSCGIIVKPGPSIEVVKPLVVRRWKDEEIIIKSKQTDPRSTINESENLLELWTHYTPEGYTMYLNNDGEDEVFEQRDYPVTFRNQSEQRFNPAFRVKMRWNQSLGYELTRQHRAIFMLRSSIDTSIQEAINSGAIQLGVADDISLMDDISELMKRKSKYIPYKNNEHKPIALPTGPLKEGMKNLKEKEKKFRQITGQVGMNVQTNSATESVINAKTGVDAVLSHLAKEMASVEEEMLKRLAIIQDPSRTGTPDLATINVQYPNTFASTENDNNE